MFKKIDALNEYRQRLRFIAITGRKSESVHIRIATWPGLAEPAVICDTYVSLHWFPGSGQILPAGRQFPGFPASGIRDMHLPTIAEIVMMVCPGIAPAGRFGAG
jgi:hypothetical protein